MHSTSCEAAVTSHPPMQTASHQSKVFSFQAPALSEDNLTNPLNDYDKDIQQPTRSTDFEISRIEISPIWNPESLTNTNHQSLFENQIGFSNAANRQNLTTLTKCAELKQNSIAFLSWDEFKLRWRLNYSYLGRLHCIVFQFDTIKSVGGGQSW